MLRPTTPREPKPSRFGLFRVRSPLLTESLICFLFLRVLRWFTSPGLLLPAYEFSGGSSDLTRKGLPHSEIPGSKPVCGSPRLIAACHVLHRFSAPRHPPSTLSSLTIKYLRRESFLFLPTLLSKIAITADQKAPQRTTSLEELSHPHDWPRCRLATGGFRPSRRSVVIESLRGSARSLVELTGIEPATYGLQSRRSPS